MVQVGSMCSEVWEGPVLTYAMGCWGSLYFVEMSCESRKINEEFVRDSAEQRRSEIFFKVGDCPIWQSVARIWHADITVGEP